MHNAQVRQDMGLCSQNIDLLLGDGFQVITSRLLWVLWDFRLKAAQENTWNLTPFPVDFCILIKVKCESIIFWMDFFFLASFRNIILWEVQHTHTHTPTKLFGKIYFDFIIMHVLLICDFSTNATVFWQKFRLHWFMGYPIVLSCCLCSLHGQFCTPQLPQVWWNKGHLLCWLFSKPTSKSV